MTIEEILAMEAGRELDALIQNKVFGMQTYLGFPGYSTDISVAWQVVEEMINQQMVKFSLSRRTDISSKWSAHFKEIAKHKPKQECQQWTAHANIAPEAICKAALLAKYSD